MFCLEIHIHKLFKFQKTTFEERLRMTISDSKRSLLLQASSDYHNILRVLSRASAFPSNKLRE